MGTVQFVLLADDPSTFLTRVVPFIDIELAGIPVTVIMVCFVQRTHVRKYTSAVHPLRIAARSVLCPKKNVLLLQRK